MNEQDSDSFEMDSSLSQKASNYDYKTAPKRPQVYSTFLQNSDQHEQTSKFKSNPNNKTYVKYPKKNNANSFKKPKYTEASDFNSSSSQHETINESEKSDEHETNPVNPIIGLNTFEFENIFMINNEYMLVSLDSQTKSKANQFCFKGKCSILLIYGFLGIAGFNLKKLSDQGISKWYDLFSPETNSYISITNKLDKIINEKVTLPQEKVSEVLYNLIKSSLKNQVDIAMHYTKLNSFLKDFSINTSSLFLIRSLNSHMCNYLNYIDNFKQVYQTRYIEMKSLNETDKNISQLGLFPISLQVFKSVHFESIEEKNICEEILSYEVDTENKFKSLNEGNKNSQIIMACGGKDVGKSTFLRYMVNSFLNKYKSVAYLDCDPGQCEYSLGGCISLTIVSEPIFGPPHSHINHNTCTNSCYYFGHLSPSDAPNHYLHCIKKCHEDFIQYITECGKNEVVPLVINTMGWNQGLGLCLLKDIVIQFKPTHIIQINHPIEANKNMPVLDKNWLELQDALSPENKLKNIKKNSRNRSFKNNNNEFSMETNDEDSVMMNESVFSDHYKDINYKLLTLKSNAPQKSQNNQTQLKKYSAKDHRNIGIIGYFAPIHDPKAYFQSIHDLRPYKVSWSRFGLHCAHAKVEYDQLFRVLNASLVGLCVVDEKYIKRNNLQLPGVLNTFDYETQKPVVYNCSGFGIIRGINMETKEFYILTPEDPKNLQKVNLIVKGMLNLPYEFFYQQDSETSSPYMSLSDNLQQQKENLIGSAPVQRKYLIHQQANSQNK